MTTFPATVPLLRERDFLRLWTAQTVSDFGARIAREGLPIMAVLVLSAGPRGLGVLAAVRGAAALAVSLASGGFVDGRRRRPVMIAVDVANHAYLPTLVSRERVTEANSRTSATEGIAEMGGPALAGVLFQWLSAPVAIIATAGTYLASALALSRIEADEPSPAKGGPENGMLEGLVTGGRMVLSHPLTRVILFTGAVGGLGNGVFSALYILYALRDLHLPTAILGAGIACGGLAALAGSFAAQPAARWLGVGRAIVMTSALSALGTLVILLAPHSRTGAIICLVIQQILGDFFGVIPIILSTSLIQSSLPATVLGRVRAVFEAASGSAAVVGALLGGAVAAVIGARSAMEWAIVGLLVGPLVARFTPLWRVREMP